METAELLSFVPVWNPAPHHALFALPLREKDVAVIGACAEELRLLQSVAPGAKALTLPLETDIESCVRSLGALGSVDHLIWVAPPTPERPAGSGLGDELVHAQRHGVLSCFRLIKALLQAGYAARPLAFTAITRQTQAVDDCERVFPEHAGVHGLMGAAAKEYAHWRLAVADVEAEGPCPLASVLQLPADPAGDAWAYRRGRWYRRELVSCGLTGSTTPSGSIARPPYRREGVYVVIGGAGGLGEVWSEHVIRHFRARVIWIGRRPGDEQIEARQMRLARLGPAPEYIQADASDPAALEQARQQIVARHGSIHGLVHAAIVLQDSSLARMSEERFEAALRAKVDTSVRTLEVFGREPLELVTFFSSLMSFGKAAGQSNYAAGCAFTDAFAQWLARNRPGLVKVINWGYWGSVGVVASPEYRARMSNAGLASIEPEEGMRALDAFLGSPLRQLASVKATPAAVSQLLRVTARERIECHASCLPDSSAATEVAGRSGRSVPADMEATLREDARQGLEKLLGGLLCARLSSLGLLTHRPVGVIPEYEPWLEESVRLLLEQGWVSRVGGRLQPADARAPEQANLPDAWARYRREQQGNVALTAQLDLVEGMLASLPDILHGVRWAVEVLFPRGTIGGVERAYQGDARVDYFNGVLVDALRTYVEARLRTEAGPSLRILEIGAGTGTTTAPVLKMLEDFGAYVGEYCYTDISRAFLRHAEQRYSSQNPSVTFRTFDVERSPREQSFDTGVYDAVIAANVLHATRDIRRTLRNTKAVLVRHGLLLMNELVTNSLIAHLTFGLTPGWWLAQDECRLRGGPGLSSSTWRRVLEAEGFDCIGFPAERAEAAGMQIILAASNGIVRLPTGPS